MSEALFAENGVGLSVWSFAEREDPQILEGSALGRRSGGAGPKDCSLIVCGSLPHPGEEGDW